ncbi:MAG: biliverdin-producing heme oxygenase, partial [Acidimicrobiia bacterium]
GPGAAFYRVERIEDPAAFKVRYRAELDAAPWDPVERARIVDEARRAYALNIGVFAELGAELG